jgi:HK97 family phage prohead protease
MATNEWLRLGSGGVVPITWDVTSKSDSGGLEGWASVFNVVDDQDEIVVPGAFKKTLAEWRQSGRTIPLSKNHEFAVDSVIGSLKSAEETPYGLRIQAGFASNPDAQKARGLAREGHLRGLSIAGPIFKSSGTIRNGKQIRVLQEVGLAQIALTAYPANTSAMTTAAKAGGTHRTDVVDVAWSAAEQLAKANTEAELRHMFAHLRAGADATAKAGYLSLHHTAGVDTPAVLSAVRDGLARLASSGLNEDEQAAVKAHLQAHVDDHERALTLLPVWEDDMRAALGISSEPVRRAAIEQLIKARYPVLSGVVSDAGAGTGDDVSKTSDHLDDASAYALGLIGESGPDTPPGGEPKSSLAEDLLASLSAAKTSVDLDALAAEIERSGT